MINIFQPNIGDESISNLKKVFSSNWLGRGELAKNFESELALFLGSEKENIHTVASCSDAIFGALRVFDFPKGASVIVPSISFPAVCSAIVECDLIPKIIDIDIETGNICLKQLKEHLDQNVVAVFATDYGGIPCDVSAIREIVGEKIKVLVDTAAAIGTFVNHEFSGKLADFCCWSFDAMKLITSGEGGCAYFKDKKLTEKFREYMYLGFSASEKSGLDRSGSNDIWWEYSPVCAGRRSVFTDVNAAIGLPSLKGVVNALALKQNIRLRYETVIDKLSNVDYLSQRNENVIYSNYFFTLRTSNRNQLALFLKDGGIYSTFRYHPLHKMKIFEKYAKTCTNATIFSSEMLNIPIHQHLKKDDVEHVCEMLIEYFI